MYLLVMYVSLTETATDDEQFDVHDEEGTALEKTLEKIAVQGPAHGVARAQGKWIYYIQHMHDVWS